MYPAEPAGMELEVYGNVRPRIACSAKHALNRMHMSNSYWLLLWNFLYGLLIAWLLLSLRISARIQALTTKI